MEKTEEKKLSGHASAVLGLMMFVILGELSVEKSILWRKHGLRGKTQRHISCIHDTQHQLTSDSLLGQWEKKQTKHGIQKKRRRGKGFTSK